MYEISFSNEQAVSVNRDHLESLQYLLYTYETE